MEAVPTTANGAEALAGADILQTDAAHHLCGGGDVEGGRGSVGQEDRDGGSPVDLRLGESAGKRRRLGGSGAGGAARSGSGDGAQGPPSGPPSPPRRRRRRRPQVSRIAVDSVTRAQASSMITAKPGATIDRAAYAMRL